MGNSRKTKSKDAVEIHPKSIERSILKGTIDRQVWLQLLSEEENDPEETAI